MDQERTEVSDTEVGSDEAVDTEAVEEIRSMELRADDHDWSIPTPEGKRICARCGITNVGAAAKRRCAGSVEREEFIAARMRWTTPEQRRRANFEKMYWQVQDESAILKGELNRIRANLNASQIARNDWRKKYLDLLAAVKMAEVGKGQVEIPGSSKKIERLENDLITARKLSLAAKEFVTAIGNYLQHCTEQEKEKYVDLLRMYERRFGPVPERTVEVSGVEDQEIPW
jgi:hypothetical protein